jgi:hypothetical protein
MAGLGQNWRPFREFADVLKASVDPVGVRIWRLDAPRPVSEAGMQTPGRRVWREKDGVL